MLVPTGNADSQFDDKMPALPRGYKNAPEMKADDNTWRSVNIAPKLWLRNSEDAIADISTYLHSIFIPSGHLAYAFVKTRTSFASFIIQYIGKPRTTTSLKIREIQEFTCIVPSMIILKS